MRISGPPLGRVGTGLEHPAELRVYVFGKDGRIPGETPVTETLVCDLQEPERHRYSAKRRKSSVQTPFWSVAPLFVTHLLKIQDQESSSTFIHHHRPRRPEELDSHEHVVQPRDSRAEIRNELGQFAVAGNVLVTIGVRQAQRKSFA